MEKELNILCPICNDESAEIWVKDRYGIPYKKVCFNCVEDAEKEINNWEFDNTYAGEYLLEDNYY